MINFDLREDLCTLRAMIYIILRSKNSIGLNENSKKLFFVQQNMAYRLSYKEI